MSLRSEALLKGEQPISVSVSVSVSATQLQYRSGSNQSLPLHSSDWWLFTLQLISDGERSIMFYKRWKGQQPFSFYSRSSGVCLCTNTGPVCVGAFILTLLLCSECVCVCVCVSMLTLVQCECVCACVFIPTLVQCCVCSYPTHVQCSACLYHSPQFISAENVTYLLNLGSHLSTKRTLSEPWLWRMNGCILT